jgi:hypothetical protein
MTQEDRLNYSAVLLEDAYRCLSTAKNNVGINDYKRQLIGNSWREDAGKSMKKSRWCGCHLLI